MHIHHRTGPSHSSRRSAESGLVRDTATAAALAALGATLWVSGQSIGGPWFSTRHVGLLNTEQMIGWAASLIGLMLLLWWILSLTIAMVAVLLCRAGHARLGSRMARYSPPFLRRLAMLVLGINLLAAPLAASATATVSATATGPAVAAGRTSEESPTLIDPLWHPLGQPSLAAPSWQPKAPPAGEGPLLHAPRGTAPNSHNGDARRVTVVSGDSLWSIAAGHLGPFATDVEVAQEWPRWYAVNRELIGSDPGLIHPGQQLLPPDTAS